METWHNNCYRKACVRESRKRLVSGVDDNSLQQQNSRKCSIFAYSAHVSNRVPRGWLFIETWPVTTKDTEVLDAFERIIRPVCERRRWRRRDNNGIDKCQPVRRLIKKISNTEMIWTRGTSEWIRNPQNNIVGGAKGTKWLDGMKDAETGQRRKRGQGL